jgi:neutral ceramidase
LSPGDFPHDLFIQIIRIDDVLLMALPYEICLEVGRRMTAHVREEADRIGLNDIRQFALISCANGFFGYVNTPEEYALQFYEGGQNFYGPRTGAFLQAAMGELLTGLNNPQMAFNLPAAWSFEMKTQSFYPKETLPKGAREIDRTPRHVAGREHDEPYWSFRWIDVPPDRINLHEPLIHIESREGDTWRPLIRDGIPVDDSGYDIAVICIDKKTRDHMGLYEARWCNPPPGKGGRFRFAVASRGAEAVLYSDEFGE